MNHVSAPPEGPLVLVAGLYGSGSTWAYNAIRMLLGDHGPVRAGYSDEGDRPPPGDSSWPMVIKCHLPDLQMRRLARLRSATVVLTVRDPRDAVASTTRRFHLPLEDVRRAVTVSAERLRALADVAPVVVLRYEDGFPKQRDTVARLARALLLETATERIDEITDSLRADRVGALITSMARDGAFGENPAPLSVDAVTQWHPAHLGDGRVGKYMDLLSVEDADAVMADTAPFCRRFGY